MNESKQIFISHSDKDGQTATYLAKALEHRGFSTWFFERDQVIGKPHFRQTADAIQNGELVLLVLTPDSCESRWVENEINIACDRNVPIIPVRYGLTHEEFVEKAPGLHAALGPVVEMDFVEDKLEDCLEKIENTLSGYGIGRKTPPTPSPPTFIEKGPQKLAEKPERKIVKHVIAGILILAMAAGLVWLTEDIPSIFGPKELAFEPDPPFDVPEAKPTMPDVKPTVPDVKPTVLEVKPIDPAAKPPTREELLACLSDSEKKFKEYILVDPAEGANAGVNKLVDEINAWSEETKKELTREEETLNNQLERVKSLQSQLAPMEKDLEEKPDPTDSAAIARYNAQVQGFNKIGAELKPLAEAYKEAEKEYNGRVADFNAEFKTRSARIDEERAQAKSRVGEYSSWYEDKGPLKLWRKLCRCFSNLKKFDRESAVPDPEIRKAIERGRKLRSEMAEHYKKEHQGDESGYVIVDVEISQEETCYMLVETSSTVSSLIPEMVDALNLGDFVGGEEEIGLANDVVTVVPQLLFPEMNVSGEESLFVKGVVINHNLPGTDGSLGLGFLQRYDYTITGTKPPSLSLQTYEKPEGDYDVFICHHRDDVKVAREVFQTLKKLGRHPFLSAMLPRSSAQELYKAVDDALAGASHMVVLTSDPSKIGSPWIEAEWRLFERLVRSGEKNGNLVSLVIGNVKPSDLPDTLNTYPVIIASDPSWAETLAGYLKPGQKL